MQRALIAEFLLHHLSCTAQKAFFNFIIKDMISVDIWYDVAMFCKVVAEIFDMGLYKLIFSVARFTE